MANEQLEQAKLEVIEYANRMLTEGLVKGTSGNVSVRVGDQVAITPGSVPYAEITPDLVAIVDLEGNHVSGGNPSSETPLHTLVYRETDAAAVVHTHSIYATTLACTVDALPAVHYMIHAFGGDTIEVSDYERFGSDELAAAVHKALGDRRGRAAAQPRRGRPRAEPDPGLRPGGAARVAGGALLALLGLRRAADPQPRAARGGRHRGRAARLRGGGRAAGAEGDAGAGS